MAGRVRKDAGKAARPHVRLSVPVPVAVYAKLCAVAAGRQEDRSALAASFVAAALKDVQILGAAKVPGGDPEDPADSQGPK